MKILSGVTDCGISMPLRSDLYDSYDLAATHNNAGYRDRI